MRPLLAGLPLLLLLLGCSQTSPTAPTGIGSSAVGASVDTPAILAEYDLTVDADRLEVVLIGHDAVRVTRAPLVEIAG